MRYKKMKNEVKIYVAHDYVQFTDGSGECVQINITQARKIFNRILKTKWLTRKNIIFHAYEKRTAPKIIFEVMGR